MPDKSCGHRRSRPLRGRPRSDAEAYVARGEDGPSEPDPTWYSVLVAQSTLSPSAGTIEAARQRWSSFSGSEFQTMADKR